LPQAADVAAIPCFLSGLTDRAEPAGATKTRPATEFHGLNQSKLVHDLLDNPRFQKRKVTKE
jgi:hypothetical protein